MSRTPFLTIRKPENIDSHLARRAAEALERQVSRGIDHYERARHLPRVLPVGPTEILDTSAGGTRKILALLARALRSERNRGRAGHWTYDLNRHIGLAQAYAAERKTLPAARP